MSGERGGDLCLARTRAGQNTFRYFDEIFEVPKLEDIAFRHFRNGARMDFEDIRVLFRFNSRGCRRKVNYLRRVGESVISGRCVRQ